MLDKNIQLSDAVEQMWYILHNNIFILKILFILEKCTFMEISLLITTIHCTYLRHILSTYWAFILSAQYSHTSWTLEANRMITYSYRIVFNGFKANNTCVGFTNIAVFIRWHCEILISNLTRNSFNTKRTKPCCKC